MTLDTLTAARAQMEVSLGFHMVFAALGIAMPLFMTIAEGLWLRTREPHYLALARRWGKATSLLFAIGAVSGTALSFELGLLWPRFMNLAGSVIGPAFALEGYAFFLEAIFIGLYLYGWERLSPRAHWLCGLAVTLSGTCSGVLVIGANAWMQAPTGFVLTGDRAEPVRVLASFGTPTFAAMALHNTLACLAASAFALAGVYAAAALRKAPQPPRRRATCATAATRASRGRWRASAAPEVSAATTPAATMGAPRASIRPVQRCGASTRTSGMVTTERATTAVPARRARARKSSRSAPSVSLTR